MINSISFNNPSFQSTARQQSTPPYQPQVLHFHARGNKSKEKMIKETGAFKEFNQFQKDFKALELNQLNLSEALQQQWAMLNVLRSDTNFNQQKVQDIQKKIKDLETEFGRVPCLLHSEDAYRRRNKHTDPTCTGYKQYQKEATASLKKFKKQIKNINTEIITLVEPGIFSSILNSILNKLTS